MKNLIMLAKAMREAQCTALRPVQDVSMAGAVINAYIKQTDFDHAIADYEKMSKTIIEEESLKEIGWKQSEYVDGIWKYYNENDVCRYSLATRRLGITKNENTDNETESSIANINTMADLYDACELCGITMKYESKRI